MAPAEQAEAEGREHPGVPDDKTQRNFTDPDSRTMPGPGGRDFQQSCNCQAVVDHELPARFSAFPRSGVRRDRKTTEMDTVDLVQCVDD